MSKINVNDISSHENLKFSLIGVSFKIKRKTSRDFKQKKKFFFHINERESKVYALMKSDGGLPLIFLSCIILASDLTFS